MAKVWLGLPLRLVTSRAFPGFHGRNSRAASNRNSLVLRDERIEFSCSMPVTFVRLLVGDAFSTSRFVMESALRPVVLMKDPATSVIFPRVKSTRPTRVFLLVSW